ncbi:hypothetical protein GCM10017708_17940 [Arthrobacter citreus]
MLSPRTARAQCRWEATSSRSLSKPARNNLQDSHGHDLRIRSLELTLTTPGALDALGRLAARFPADVDIGMGGHDAAGRDAVGRSRCPVYRLPSCRSRRRPYGPELLGDALLPGGNLDSLAERAREVRAGAERGRNRAP